MNIVIDVAFVVAVTAFLKTQFGLTGSAVLLSAFVISLVVGGAPLLAAAVPLAAPWITLIVNTFALFLGAAGSYDAVKSFILIKK